MRCLVQGPFHPGPFTTMVESVGKTRGSQSADELDAVARARQHGVDGELLTTGQIEVVAIGAAPARYG